MTFLKYLNSNPGRPVSNVSRFIVEYPAPIVLCEGLYYLPSLDSELSFTL